MVYEAAAEAGLPITVHPNSGEGIFRTSPSWAGGSPTYYVEWHTGLSQVFAANLVSLVCHGVFERFPGLKVVLTSLPAGVRERVRAMNAVETCGDRL